MNLGLAMAVVTALSWAVLAIALKLAVQTLSAGTVVWARLISAFILMFVIFAFYRRDQLKILIRPPWLGVLAAALIATNYYGFMKGIEFTGASNAQIMIQLAPLGFAVLSVLAFHEIPTRRQSIGIALALLGFSLFYWDQLLISLQHLQDFQAGNAWLLIAAAAWAGFALIQKWLLKSYPPQQFNLLIYAVSAIVLFPVADLSQLHHLSGLNVGLLIFLALNTVIGYGALSEAILRIPATHVSMIIALNPLLTLAIMAELARRRVGWISSEPIGWRGWAGAIFVIAGVITTVSQKTSRFSRGLDTKPASL